MRPLLARGRMTSGEYFGGPQFSGGYSSRTWKRPCILTTGDNKALAAEDFTRREGWVFRRIWPMFGGQGNMAYFPSGPIYQTGLGIEQAPPIPHLFEKN
jgi:hypothetical protein